MGITLWIKVRSGSDSSRSSHFAYAGVVEQLHVSKHVAIHRIQFRIQKDKIMKFRRYPDGCYAVVVGSKRGPCANSKVTALSRFKTSGLIALASKGA
jgi:hypothetical protein